jgi:hypothetical protein
MSFKLLMVKDQQVKTYYTKDIYLYFLKDTNEYRRAPNLKKIKTFLWTHTNSNL